MESSPSFSAVAPVRPAAAYIGGKRNLARRLVSLIETIPHRTYAEPFVGMGGVFLRRRQRPQAEVVNDWSQDVATFYRVLQRHYVAFCETDYGADLFSRDQFEVLADALDNIEGAFILSLNDRPEVRETFARFRIEAVTTTYSVQGGGQAAGEVIIQRR